MDNTKRRSKRLCVNVSIEAWNLLQAYSLQEDRHAINVASEIVESALSLLEDHVNISRSESPSGSTEEVVS